MNRPDSKTQQQVNRNHPLVTRPTRYVCATSDGVFAEGTVDLAVDRQAVQEALEFANMWAEALKP